MTSRRLKALLVLSLLIAVGSAPAAIAAAAPAPKAKISDYLTPRDLDRSKRYRGPLYALAFAGMAATLAAGAAMGLGRGSRWLGRWVSSAVGDRWWLQAILLAGVITVVTTLVSLAFGYGRYLHDRHWGLSTQSAAGYLFDVAKGTAFEFVLTAITALVFFGIVRALPRSWPAVAAVFVVGLTVLLVLVLPVIYEPLFNKFTPVPAEVRQRVLSIADKAGVRVGDVLVADASRRTTRQNAYVSGLGSTKRVVLYDTLLERSSPKQVDLVVAHELSHVAHKDVLKGTALGALGAVLSVLLLWRLFEWQALRDSLGVSGPGDPRSLPFIAFLLAAATLLSLPVVNAFSRGIEAAADRSAIEITRDPDTAIQVEVSLARSNLSDLEPNRAIYLVFFTHPSAIERIQLALDWRAAHPGG
jgi:Zn-dependent protease with chaperone function